MKYGSAVKNTGGRRPGFNSQLQLYSYDFEMGSNYKAMIVLVDHKHRMNSWWEWDYWEWLGFSGVWPEEQMSKM